MDELILAGGQAAGSAAAGGVFGLLGTALGRLGAWFERRQAHAHEQRRWSHEARMHELDAAREAARSEAALAQTDAEGGWRGLSASMQAEAALPPGPPFVDAVRGLTRPALTALLWLIALGVFLVSGAEARAEISDAAVFAATAATLWWFGDRGPRLKG